MTLTRFSGDDSNGAAICCCAVLYAENSDRHLAGSAASDDDSVYYQLVYTSDQHRDSLVNHSDVSRCLTVDSDPVFRSCSLKLVEDTWPNYHYCLPQRTEVYRLSQLDVMECDEEADMEASTGDPLLASLLPLSPASCSHTQSSPPHVIVDDSPLQRQMLRNKQSLKVKLMTRRPMNELVDQGIFPSLNASPALFEQRRRLARAKTGDRLRAKIARRPERHELVQQHILLEDAGGCADPSLIERRRQLKRARLADTLNDQLSHRPGPLELIRANILHTDEGVEKAVKEGAINFLPTCQGEVRHKSSQSLFHLDDSSSSSSCSSSSSTAVDDTNNSAAGSPSDKHSPATQSSPLFPSSISLPELKATARSQPLPVSATATLQASSATTPFTSVTSSLTSVPSALTSASSSFTFALSSLTSASSSFTSTSSSLNSISSPLLLKPVSVLGSLAAPGHVASVSSDLLSGTSSLHHTPLLLVSPSTPSLPTVSRSSSELPRPATFATHRAVFAVNSDVLPGSHKPKQQKQLRRHSTNAVTTLVTTQFTSLQPTVSTISAPCSLVSAPSTAVTTSCSFVPASPAAISAPSSLVSAPGSLVSALSAPISASSTAVSALSAPISASSTTVPASSAPVSASSAAVSPHIASDFCSDSVLAAVTSSHRQHLPAARDKKKKKTSSVSGSAVTSSVSSRTSNSTARTKTIKFHEYKGPPSATRIDNSLIGPAPVSGNHGNAGESGADSDGESSYHLLLKQQQLFLQWQLEWSHKYPQILLPANNKPPVFTTTSTANNNNNAVRFTVVSTVGSNGPQQRQQQQQKLSGKPSVNRLIDQYTARLEAMRVSALRVELKQRSLPVSGSKSQLVERLRPFAAEILSPITSPATASATASADLLPSATASSDLLSSSAADSALVLTSADSSACGDDRLVADSASPSTVATTLGHSVLVSEVEMTSATTASSSSSSSAAGSIVGGTSEVSSSLPPSDTIKMEVLESQPLSVMSCTVTSPPPVEADWSLDVMSNAIGCDSTNQTSLSSTDLVYSLIDQTLSDCSIPAAASVPIVTTASHASSQPVSDTGLFSSVQLLSPEYDLTDVDHTLLTPLAESAIVFTDSAVQDLTAAIPATNSDSTAFIDNDIHVTGPVNGVSQHCSVTSSASQPISTDEIDSSTGDVTFDGVTSQTDVNNTQLAIQLQLQRVQQLQQQLEQSQLILQQQQQILRIQSEQQQLQKQQHEQQQQPSLKRGLVRQHIEQKLTAHQLQQQLDTLHKLQSLQQSHHQRHSPILFQTEVSGKMSNSSSFSEQHMLDAISDHELPLVDTRWEACSTVTSSNKHQQNGRFSHSQDMDDVLDILINNGELPASAASLPPVSPLPTADIIADTPWLARDNQPPPHPLSSHDSAISAHFCPSALVTGGCGGGGGCNLARAGHCMECTDCVTAAAHNQLLTAGNGCNLTTSAVATATNSWLPSNGDAHNTCDPLLSQNTLSTTNTCEFMDFTV